MLKVEKHWGVRTKAIEPHLIPFRERLPHCDIPPLKFFGRDKDAIGLSQPGLIGEKNCLEKGVFGNSARVGINEILRL